VNAGSDVMEALLIMSQKSFDMAQSQLVQPVLFVHQNKAQLLGLFI